MRPYSDGSHRRSVSGLYDPATWSRPENTAVGGEAARAPQVVPSQRAHQTLIAETLNLECRI
jgi:hypothetical protein